MRAGTQITGALNTSVVHDRGRLDAGFGTAETWLSDGDSEPLQPTGGELPAGPPRLSPGDSCEVEIEDRG